MAQNTNENRSRTSSNFGWLCVCCVMLFLCLSIGTYIEERFEEKEFVKTSCYVRTFRVESHVCRRIPDHICYFPIWEVEYSGNITENATVIENSNYRRNSYSIALALKEQFQIGSTYPCWYKFYKPDKLQWYKPTALGLILVIFAVILSVIATIYCFITDFSSSHPDL